MTLRACNHLSTPSRGVLRASPEPAPLPRVVGRAAVFWARSHCLCPCPAPAPTGRLKSVPRSSPLLLVPRQSSPGQLLLLQQGPQKGHHGDQITGGHRGTVGHASACRDQATCGHPRQGVRQEGPADSAELPLAGKQGPRCIYNPAPTPGASHKSAISSAGVKIAQWRLRPGAAAWPGRPPQAVSSDHWEILPLPEPKRVSLKLPGLREALGARDPEQLCPPKAGMWGALTRKTPGPRPETGVWFLLLVAPCTPPDRGQEPGWPQAGCPADPGQ